MQMIVKWWDYCVIGRDIDIDTKSGSTWCVESLFDKFQRIMAKIDFSTTSSNFKIFTEAQKNDVVPIWVAVNVE